MKLHRLFLSRYYAQSRLTWREVLEDFRLLKSLMSKLILAVFDGYTKQNCIAIHLFASDCHRIYKKSGALFLALYLKQCKASLLRFYSKDSVPISLSVHISLTRSGIPRIIPSFHRKEIRSRSDKVFQLYVSLFSLSKLITLAAPVSEDTFSSMRQPSSDNKYSEVLKYYERLLPDLIQRYIPFVSKIPFNQGLSFMPNWKSSPTSAIASHMSVEFLKFSEPEKVGKFKRKASFLHSFKHELASFCDLTTLLKSVRPFGLQTELWAPYTRFAFDDSGNSFVSLCSHHLAIIRILWPYAQPTELVPRILGKLCCSYSGDGKRRVFAVGNYINQRLLYPFHKWLMTVLRGIPMDGTFNQTRPLDRLRGLSGYVASVDLKSATDRWPLLFLSVVITTLFGGHFSNACVLSCLGFNVFDITFTKKRNRVAFCAGQPLGYYSSWPLFALSHHTSVWFAAEQVYPGRLFKDYAILGDDVVIADKTVATIYMDLLSFLDVKISTSKSIISPIGMCEFAKKIRVNNLEDDVSPVSIKKALLTHSPIGWYNFIMTLSAPLRLCTMLRLAGVGFKARSRPLTLMNHHGRKVKRLLVLYWHQKLKVSVALCLLVVFGKVIPPAVYGRIFYMLYERLAPKEPQLPPDGTYLHPDDIEMLERTVMVGWMKQYLDYLLWYNQVIFQPGVRIDDLLNAPVFISTWHVIDTSNLKTVRYGAAFIIYDWCEDLLNNLPKELTV